MDPLSISANFIAVLQLTGTVIQYLNAVTGAPKDRQQLLLELSSISGMLIVLQDQAEDANEESIWSSTLQSLNLPNGPLAQFKACLEELTEKLAPVDGWKKIGKAFTWPFDRDEIYRIMNAIERQKAMFNLARQNDHIALSKAMKHDIEAIDHKIDEIHGRMAQMHLATDREKLCRWLGAPDPSMNYNKALKDRHIETGTWLISSDAFKEWKSEHCSCLWLYGIPGCGKTILSAIVLEKILPCAAEKSAVLYFFFDFNDTEKRRYDNMTRSLISQLLMHKRTKDFSRLESLYSSCLNGERQPAQNALLAALRGMLSATEETFIVIDALDECMDRSELLANIEEILGWTEINMHILTTSRKERVIEESMGSLTAERSRINLQSALINPDICVYIRDRLQSDRKLKRWQKEPNLQLEIESILMSKADGMFRWVACQLDSLGNCFNVPALRKVLASLPKTLDETYARILSNVDESHVHCVYKILQWLTFSTRPLEIEELAEVVAIDVNEQPRFDPEKRFADIHDILEPCSSLITTIGDAYCIPKLIYLDENGVQCGADNENDRTYVRLAHSSVKEFLLSQSNMEGSGKAYGMEELASNGLMAEDCIAYLIHIGQVDPADSELVKIYPLARYAASCWSRHVQMADHSNERVTSYTMELLQPKKTTVLNTWIRLYNFETFHREQCLNESDSAHPLYFSALLGLIRAARSLIKQGADVNARCGAHGNALCAAIWGGHEEMVQILLDKGASINLPGRDHGNALQTASWLGNGNMVSLFLELGAELNAPGFSGKTALMEAVEAGQEDLVQVLLSKGADVDLQGIGGNTPLIKAAQHGYRNISRLLLDAGANVNSQDFRGSSALSEAAGKDDVEVARILMEYGADADLQCEGGEVALSKAARAGHDRVIRQLLRHEAKGEFQIQELMHLTKKIVLYGSYQNVVEVLLEEMSDRRYRDSQGRTVLHYAAASGRISSMEVLLKHKADLLAVDKQGRGCLHHAASKGGSGVVKWILEKLMIDPDSTDRDGWTALHWACRSRLARSADIRRCLQDAGAHSNMEDIEALIGLTPDLVSIEPPIPVSHVLTNRTRRR